MVPSGVGGAGRPGSILTPRAAGLHIVPPLGSRFGDLLFAGDFLHGIEGDAVLGRDFTICGQALAVDGIDQHFDVSVDWRHDRADQAVRPLAEDTRTSCLIEIDRKGGRESKR